MIAQLFCNTSFENKIFIPLFCNTQLFNIVTLPRTHGAYILIKDTNKAPTIVKRYEALVKGKMS